SNGTKTFSNHAFIGNYGFQPLSNDFTNPAQYHQLSGTHSFSGYGLSDFNNAKLNMAMPELYPGSGSFRNPAAGNSSAPNIRSALFNMPILRLGQIKINTDPDERIVPYIARFNNFGNGSLDTDRDSSNKFMFIPGAPLPGGNGFP